MNNKFHRYVLLIALFLSSVCINASEDKRMTVMLDTLFRVVDTADTAYLSRIMLKLDGVCSVPTLLNMVHPQHNKTILGHVASGATASHISKCVLLIQCGARVTQNISDNMFFDIFKYFY